MPTGSALIDTDATPSSCAGVSHAISDVDTSVALVGPARPITQYVSAASSRPDTCTTDPPDDAPTFGVTISTRGSSRYAYSDSADALAPSSVTLVKCAPPIEPGT